MSVGFGFSAGDFISALELVATVIDALRESGASSAEYRALVSQLHTLETALIRVKRLELDDSQYAEVVALRQAASQCQRTIDAFWGKIKKYQPSLRTGGSGSRVLDGWMKIKWALCQKEDLIRFKADLMGHTESIEMLLATVQMAATRIDSKRNDQYHQTLAGKVQESYFGCMRKMTVVLERVSTGIQQGKELLDMTRRVIQTNVQVFQIVLNIQNIITKIPGQVDRQQPVYFVDALSRNMSFDLEFIMSADALKSVLYYNFKNIGRGATKIENGEFAIQDSATQMDVDLSSAWETCFYPRQHVAMSMVFNSQTPNRHCPKCFANNVVQDDEDIECEKCHMIYRRSVAIESIESEEILSLSSIDPRSFIRLEPEDFYPLHKAEKSPRLKRKRSDDEDEEMALFRRVRIKTSIFLPAKESRPGSPASVRHDESAVGGDSKEAFPSPTEAAWATDHVSAYGDFSGITEDVSNPDGPHLSANAYYQPSDDSPDPPPARRPSLRRNSVSHLPDLDQVIRVPALETLNKGRRRASYYRPSNDSVDVSDSDTKVRQAQNYQKDITSPEPLPLTTDMLKRQQHRQISSSRSTKSSGSRDEPEYRKSATTRTTRSGSNGDDNNVTIKVTGTARVMVGGVQIDCSDSGEIEIKRQKSIRNGSEKASEYGGAQRDRMKDRRSKVDRPTGRSRLRSTSNHSHTRATPQWF